MKQKPTHCNQGHPLEGDNARPYITSTGKKSVRCAICFRRYSNAWKKTPKGRKWVKEYSKKRNQ